MLYNGMGEAQLEVQMVYRHLSRKEDKRCFRRLEMKVLREIMMDTFRENTHHMRERRGGFLTSVLDY